jgi:hypothetical protein
MFGMLNGAHVTGVVACLARLNIPELVEAGPKSPEELAAQIGVKAQPLYRLMRASASVGVLEELPDGRFAETPLSAVLRANANPSLKALAIMTARPWHWQGWAHLEDCVRTGRQALDLLESTPFFEFLDKNPEEARVFDAAMTALSMLDAPAITAAYSFEGMDSIVDVAGGVGYLLAKILSAHPRMRATLYDLPHVIERAKSGPLAGVIDRCSFESGDMFASVPAGRDAYMMKHIIHDWPDEPCIQLLKACRSAVNANGRLLVIDNVIQPGNDFHPGKFLDLQMLIFPGGRERTEQEFRELFEASGWKLVRVIATAVPESILECVAV